MLSKGIPGNPTVQQRQVSVLFRQTAVACQVCALPSKLDNYQCSRGSFALRPMAQDIPLERLLDGEGTLHTFPAPVGTKYGNL